jgi:hypothetical protein
MAGRHLRGAAVEADFVKLTAEAESLRIELRRLVEKWQANMKR